MSCCVILDNDDAMKYERYLNVKKMIKTMCFLVSILFLTGFYDPGINYIEYEEVTLELGDGIYQEKLKYINNYFINNNFRLEDNIPKDESGHTTKIGSFNYYIVHIDEERMYSRITKSIATISVVDTVKPELKIKEGSLKFNYGASIKPSDVVTCYDLSKCSLSFKNKVNNKKVGTQEVIVVALDEGNNTNEISVKITIKERPYYSSSYVSMDNSNNSRNSKLSLSDKVNLRNELVAYAKQFEGNPYVYGGNSLTNGIDCSGFTQQIYKHFGYRLPRTAAGHAYLGKSISNSQLLPGDIIIFHKNGVGYHVALYIGNNKVIHAGTPKTGIQITKLWKDPQFYRRIIY